MIADFGTWNCPHALVRWLAHDGDGDGDGDPS